MAFWRAACAMSSTRCATQRAIGCASGADDDYGGWARAFHQEAGVADSIVHVAAGTTSVVELRLRLEADSCVIEGAVRKFKCQIWN